jgi:hypothetical protein
MPSITRRHHGEQPIGPAALTTQLAAFAMIVNCLFTGCAALTNPVLNGIPVRRLPTELLSGPRRDNLLTVPLSLLSQNQPDDYILAAGDVLGIFIAGVFPLTLENQQLPAPPVNYPSRIDPLGAGLPPSLGYPILIRKDGTIALPLVDPIRVDGLNVEQANEVVRDAYLEKGLLQKGREAILVTLLQPRQIRVLVFRQEVGGFAAGGRGDIAVSNRKQGTANIVDLRAYENDVLNAIAYTGGLPGLDAYDGIYVFRGGQKNADLTQRLETIGPDKRLTSLVDLDVDTVHIPTRWPAGEPVPFQPGDVVLHAGDVVFLEARTLDLFYTGGLLPSGERVLPRDYDLDVVEAVAQIQGTLLNGAFGGNNLTGQLINPRQIGNPSPSALTVIRRTPGGGQVPISVDLNRALTDPRERILVQAGDILILQETAGEAIARYMSQAFNFSLISDVIERGSTTGTTALSTP